LWNAVWFRDKPPYARSFAFLDRAAGGALLDIRFNDSAAEPVTDDVMTKVMDRLAPMLPYVRMFIVLLQEWEPILTVLKRLHESGAAGGQFALERFEVHRQGDISQWPGRTFQPAGHDRHMYPFLGGVESQPLVHFSVSGLHVDWDKSIIKNLTTLDIRRIPLSLAPTPVRFQTILRESPRLEKLSLDGAGPNGMLPPMGQPLRLDYLNTLVLAHFSPDYAEVILTYFIAPNVKDLTLMGFSQVSYANFYDSLAGRFPKMRVLTMFAMQLATAGCERALCRALHTMPKIGYLKLGFVGADILRLFLLQPSTWKIHSAIDPRLLPDFIPVRPLPDAVSPRRRVDALVPAKNVDPKTDLLCPKIQAIEIQDLDATLMTPWLIGRWAGGCRVPKLFFTKGKTDPTEPLPSIHNLLPVPGAAPNDPPAAPAKPRSPLDLLKEAVIKSKIPVSVIYMAQAVRSREEMAIMAEAD
jgi:hypothetical protein